MNAVVVIGRRRLVILQLHNIPNAYPTTTTTMVSRDTHMVRTALASPALRRELRRDPPARLLMFLDQF